MLFTVINVIIVGSDAITVERKQNYQWPLVLQRGDAITQSNFKMQLFVIATFVQIPPKTGQHSPVNSRQN